MRDRANLRVRISARAHGMVGQALRLREFKPLGADVERDHFRAGQPGELHHRQADRPRANYHHLLAGIKRGAAYGVRANAQRFDQRKLLK